MLLSLAMLFTLAPTAFAEENTATNGEQTETPKLTNPATEGTSGGIDWKVKDGVLTISATSSVEDTYTAGQMKNYTSQTGEKVTEPTGWYALKDSITEIRIEEGVTYLGNYAFSYLTNAVKVNIPASITGLGNYIFRGDTALTTVEWASDFKAPEITDTDSSSATYTGKYVPTSMFDGCTSLGSGKELSDWLPDSFAGVGCAAFRGTQFTVNFDDWNNLTYIGAYGFAGMPNLASFTLSTNITLGLRGGSSNAFNGSGLKSLTVAEGITEIPGGMCNGCEQLSSVALADSVTTIAKNAFFNTKALEQIDLKNVQRINEYAFWGSGLTDLVLPESVKKVENRAFEACTSLTKVTINATDLTLENNNTFAGCNLLNKVVTSAGSRIGELNASAFGPDNSYGSKDYKQAPVESIEINGTVNTLNFSALSSLKSLTINGKNTWQGNALPSGFENLVINGDSWSVGGYQFQGSAHVEHLTVFADNVSAADKSEAAFRSNPYLETAQFTGKTVKLQDKMFLGCTNLKWLDLSIVGTLTVGSSCFGDDTSESYGATPENPNKFNEGCVIYAKDAEAAQTLRGNGSGLDNTKGIVLVVNGGTVDTAAENAGFSAVTRSGYTAKWYTAADFSGNAVTAAPTAGQTYYAKWEEKAERTAPVAPTLKDCTYTSITLNTIEGAQYRCNGGAWQTSPEFTGLTAGTTYNFEAYYPETADRKASPTSGKVEFSTLRHSSSSSSSNPTYSVTTPSKSENGGVAVSSKNARKGDAVTVTVTPDAGYQLDKLTVTDKNGNVLKLTDKGDGKYSFTMPDGKVEVKAAFVKKVETRPFGDVSADAYYNQAVRWAQEKGITDGISSDLFGPKQPCTRSQIVTFLWRAAGSPEPKSTAAGMTDVAPGSYYAKAVAWAVENGITSGTAEGTFSPDATCTRAQAVTFLARAQNAKATGKTAFSDVPADSYFADAVAWAQANGVTTGTSETTFSPDSDCTRAQIVTFLYRANQGT